MTLRPVVARPLARRDVDEAVDHYIVQGGRGVALAFIASLESAYRHLARYPDSGAPRFGHELELPGLRSWPLTGFPYVVFYAHRGQQVDVWRVLHAHRDIPAWLQDPGEV